jgi:DNA replication protein DnaC
LTRFLTLIDARYLADRATSRLIKRLSRLSILVIDELSYMSLKPEQCNAFFRLMDQRYNRISTVITSNLEPREWHTIFQNKNLLDALLDRLQHHCIKVHIDGPSLRSPENAAESRAAKKTKQASS